MPARLRPTWPTLTRGDVPTIKAMVLKIEKAANQPIRWRSARPAERVQDWFEFSESKQRELREASLRPLTQFPAAPTNLFGSTRLNFVDFRKLAQRASVLASAELDLGNPERASESLRVNMAISRGLLRDNVLVGTMIGIAIDNLSLRVVWQGISEKRWDPSQLIEIDRLLGERNLPAAIQDEMRHERANGIRLYADNEQIFRANDYLAKMIGGPPLPKWKLLSRYFVPEGWADLAKAQYAQLIQDSAVDFFDRARRIVQPSVMIDVETELARIVSSKRPRDHYLQTLLPNFIKSYVIATRTQVRIDHARIAIAIERFYMRHGNLPGNFDELSPEFIEEVPRDPFGGKPYGYRVLSEGNYMIWSVGWNESDEDGLVSASRTDGDWVWFSFAKKNESAVVDQTGGSKREGEQDDD